MTTPTTLRGITWNHTRGYAPVAVTGQVYVDRHPDVEITWDRRSLWAFGEQPLEEIVAAYDLLVIDHPTIAWAATANALLPIDVHLGSDQLAALREDAVGRSQESYAFGGHEYALAVDAACQVAAARPDLLEAAGERVPTTWDEVVSLARRTGRVALPLNAIDAFSSFLTLCAHLGAPAGTATDGRFVDEAVAVEVLGRLVELVGVVPSWCATANPIATLNRLATTDEVAYCPLAFGYTNYSRDGYAPRILTFHDIPCVDGTVPRGSCLGGAGLAVSASSDQVEQALDYACWVASPETQSTEYVRAGGQPAASRAWEDPEANRLTREFFRATRQTIESAYLRPRHPDYPQFQSDAAVVVRDALLSAASGAVMPTSKAAETVARLEDMYEPCR